MHELIQSEIQSDIISEKKFVTSGGSVPFPFREIYPTLLCCRRPEMCGNVRAVYFSNKRT